MPLQDGKWDAAFQATKTDNTGFDLAGSPFGEDNFDHWNFENNNTYATMFDGFVFYKPVEEFKLVTGLLGLMEDGFFEEAVLEQEMYNKAISNYKKQTLSPVDIEWIKQLNEMKVNSVPNLDNIKCVIEKWLN